MFDDKYNELYELSTYNPFEIIKKQIIMLGKIVGFTSINDIIYLNSNIINYEFNKQDNKILELLTNVFMPLDFVVLNTDTQINIIVKKKMNLTYHVLLNNYCEVEFSIGNELFKISGYIKNDPLNIYIRTSQISNDYLYNKKLTFEKIINLIEISNKNKNNSNNIILSKENITKLSKINKLFADVYLKI